MSETPQLLRPTRNLSGQSPTRHRLGDDILAHLSPQSAVEALKAPVGALKSCLDGASASERDFTMRTAIASEMICEWVEELSDWSWPTEGGSSGFEIPGGKRRKLSIEVTAPEGEDNDYMGSLLRQDVARYERRIDDISRDMEELAVEEIKAHVLTNHIMPLSRPTTPLSDGNRSSMSLASSYNKMEDLSAVVTAIVVQTLPNLAKLSRLLQIWSIRLTVLQRIPPLLIAIEDAEIALKSGWNAVVTPAPSEGSEEKQMSSALRSMLSRKDFEVMKIVLEKKISKPGRTLDYMLDCLEGLQDTLPDGWLDRMEAVERDYTEWFATCERKIREAEWARAIQSRNQSQDGSSPPSPDKTETDYGLRKRQSNGVLAMELAGQSLALPRPSKADGIEEPSKERRDASRTRQDGVDNDLDGSLGKAGEPTVQGDTTRGDMINHTNINALSRDSDAHRDLDEDEVRGLDVTIEGADLDDQPELPPLRNTSRRNSNASHTSTVIHGASSHFGGLSSEPPEVSGSPVISKNRVHEVEYARSSPPSSPPLPVEDTQESSVAPFDGTAETSIQEYDDSMPPQTPMDDSFVDDFDDSMSVSDAPSPSKHRESKGDQQLRQQISEIIESIPAKIKLTANPPTVNLNPPDLQLPRIRKKPSQDRFKRSGSSMSSRAGTPSFTLSPAKSSRPRHQHGQQEIKVYHLSRSSGEAPIKLFIRCVGERGERVMVRVGGGWADLSEYLKDYASHHGRRSGGRSTTSVEVRDVPRAGSSLGVLPGSSPPSRPASALEAPTTPLAVRKTRRSSGAAGNEVPRFRSKTPSAAMTPLEDTPQSDISNRSRSSSRLSWADEDSSILGLAGPSGKKVEMSEENKAWVESVKEKVRLASGERRVSGANENKRFGELGKVGGTKRVFRKSEDRRDIKK